MFAGTKEEDLAFWVVICASAAVGSMVITIIALCLYQTASGNFFYVCKNKCRSWIRRAYAAATTTSDENMMDDPEQGSPDTGLPPEPVSGLPPNQSVVCLPQQPVYSPKAYARAHLQKVSST